MKRYIPLILLLITSLHALADMADSSGRRQQQEQLLAEASSPADSTRILFNIFDLAHSQAKTATGLKLVDVCKRSKQEAVAFDMIRNLANLNMRSDSLLDILMKRTMEFPASSDRKQTVTFIRLMKNQARLKFSDEQEKLNALHELLRHAEDSPKGDIYDQLVLLHALCICLNEYPEDDISKGYVERVNRLVEKLPESDYALRNLFYVNAAIAYTRAGEHTKAILFDHKLLEIISQLENRNLQNGREFKNYDSNLYVIYTRLLSNYPGLTDGEVEEYYKKCLEIIERDPRARQTNEKAPLPSIYYSMYKKNYPWALALLNGCIDADIVKDKRIKLMRMMIEAATAINDSSTLNNIYPRYINALEDYIHSRIQEKYRVLQVIYDVREMQAENLRLIDEHQRELKRRWRTTTLLCTLIMVVLLASVIVLFRMNRRTRGLVASLAESNRDLEEERKNLLNARNEIARSRDQAEKANQMKTDFINNMSHEVKAPLQALREYSYLIAESTDDHKKKYLMQFADLLMLNSELVETIVNDVLQLAELHNSTIKINTEPLYLKPICEAAIDTVKHRLQPGVTLKFTGGDSNLLVYADRHRLMQILINLLTNASKFTHDGSISLSFEASKEAAAAKIYVTDTGIGITPHNSERIFERFVKINPDSQGVGLGLTISRMLARLMNGDIILDTSYTGGARFVVTVPTE